jgi:hypothetical protein
MIEDKFECVKSSDELMLYITCVMSCNKMKNVMGERMGCPPKHHIRCTQFSQSRKIK